MTISRPTRREFLQLGMTTALVPGLVLPANAAADPSRLALVVGNDAYPGAPLSNAVNDAKAMSALLGEAGFGVDLRTNVDRATFADATRRFAEAAQKSDVKLVMFYYAGHGAQLDWRNYLLPVDARVNTSADLPAQCVDLASLLTELARARGRTFVIVLDACRDNPFGASFRPAQKGLSQFDAPPGSLLAFSTAPGSVAADASGASGQSGLYAEHLVRELGVRGDAAGGCAEAGAPCRADRVEGDAGAVGIDVARERRVPVSGDQEADRGRARGRDPARARHLESRQGIEGDEGVGRLPARLAQRAVRRDRANAARVLRCARRGGARAGADRRCACAACAAQRRPRFRHRVRRRPLPRRPSCSPSRASASLRNSSSRPAPTCRC